MQRENAIRRTFAVAAWVILIAFTDPSWASGLIEENFDSLQAGAPWPSQWEVTIDGAPTANVSVSKLYSLSQPNCGMLLTTSGIDVSGSTTNFSVRRPLSGSPPGAPLDLKVDVRLPNRIRGQFALGLAYDAPGPQSTCLLFASDNTVALYLDGQDVSGPIERWQADTWIHVHWTIDPGLAVSMVQIGSGPLRTFAAPSVYERCRMSSFQIIFKQGIPLPAFVDNISLRVDGSPCLTDDPRDASSGDASSGGDAGLTGRLEGGGNGVGGGGLGGLAGASFSAGTGIGSDFSGGGFGGAGFGGGGFGTGGFGGGGFGAGGFGGGGFGDGGFGGGGSHSSSGSGNDGSSEGGGTVTPEPSTAALWSALGCLGLMLLWRHRRAAKTSTASSIICE